MGLSNRLLLSVWPSAAIAICFILSSCDGNSVTLWSTESKSPCGDWIAQASTLQSSGFGAAAVGTGVYLRKTGELHTPIQVLGFSNYSAYPVGSTSVRLTWMNDSHLDVIYNKNAKLNFQEIKVNGVEVTVRQAKYESAIRESVGGNSSGQLICK